MWMGLFFLALVGATQPSDEVRQWLDDLASPDAAIRDAARQEMLGMSRPQLLSLRRLVAEGAAATPAQREALFDIVRHVYLATEPYPANPERTSFLGLSQWIPVVENDKTIGLIFERRLPGFPAFAAMQDGDVLVGVKELPDLDFRPRLPLQPIRDQFSPGSVINLQLVRDNRLVTVELKLAPTPAWQQDAIVIQNRETEALVFWLREFQPLLESKSM